MRRDGTVGKYDATMGVAINANFITGTNGPLAISADGTALFVTNNANTVGEYNATTGAAINPNFITGPSGLTGDLAIDGTALLVANTFIMTNITPTGQPYTVISGTVGEYNATTGAAINPNFITGLSGPFAVGPSPSSPPTPTVKELVWENTVTGQRSIWVMQNGVPEYVISLPTISIQWRIAAAADFLGTGQADLVWENTITGQRSIWVMRNGVPEYVITLPTISIQWRIAAAADFLGTGQADLVWDDTVTGQHSIWVMQNGVPEYVITLPTSPIQWRIAAAADFPGTGQADLVWENTVTGEHTMWVLNKGVPFSSIKLPTIFTEWQIVD